MHSKNIHEAGVTPGPDRKILILLHGRGGSAEDILTLSAHLKVDGFALLAPQATNNTWYPYSFMAPVQQNEPWLSSALTLLKEILQDCIDKGISAEQIYIGGFSQGACLALEFAARNATKFGGVFAFTGGLIGDKLLPENYSGNFHGTPVFIGTSDPDPHVPMSRVDETVEILNKMNASVTLKVYNNMGHTINSDEIDNANSILVSNL